MTTFSKPGAELTTCRKVFAFTSLISFVFCVGMLAGGYQAMVNAILKTQLEVVEGSRAYELWIESPIPLYMKIYFFNLTNPDEFTNGATPKLQELGPYTFRQFQSKVTIGDHLNGTITYLLKKTWVFNQELSGDNHLEDVITTVNTIPVAAAFSLNTNPLATALFGGFNTFLNEQEEPLIIRETAGDILFFGYQDPLLDFVQDAKKNDNPILDFLQISDELFEYDKFAWYYKRNGSVKYDGVFNMFTGETRLEDVGRINRWNYVHQTDYFDGYACNHVSGSAGEQFTPGLTQDSISFISPDLCMTMTVPFLKEQTDSNGFNTYRFIGNAESFEKRDASCYCVSGTCAPRGLLNAQACKFGSPAFISYPHFLFADPELLASVEGLQPIEEKHLFYMDILPELGVPTDVAARMQINLQVVPYNKILRTVDILAHVPEVKLPMMWFEVLASLDDQLVEELTPVVFILQTAFFPIFFGVLALLNLIGFLLAMSPICRAVK